MDGSEQIEGKWRGLSQGPASENTVTGPQLFEALSPNLPLAAFLCSPFNFR